jgi:hypothetical protein
LFFTHDLGCALAAATVDGSGKFGVADERATVEGLDLD